MKANVVMNLLSISRRTLHVLEVPFHKNSHLIRCQLPTAKARELPCDGIVKNTSGIILLAEKKAWQILQKSLQFDCIRMNEGEDSNTVALMLSFFFQ